MTLDDLAGAPEPKQKRANKAVIDGELQTVSPSQIKSFSACNRAWWFDKVAGLRPPEEEEPEHLAVGTRFHKQMEDYYELDKTPDNESCRYVLTLPGVPSRSEVGICIEEPRDYGLGLYAAGVPMRGRIDLRAPPKDGTFIILDWKTCKNFKYCKTPEELARDVQGIVYLKYGFEVYKEQAVYGKFLHAYIRTERVGAQVIDSGPLDKSHVNAVYSEIEQVVEEIKVAAAIKDQDDVPFDKSACFAYGGCPFQKHCNAFKRKKETMANNLDNGFLARMRAAKSGAQTKDPEVKAQEVKDPAQDRADVNKSVANLQVTLPESVNQALKANSVNIVPPDAPKPEKVEPGPEVKKILEDLRTGKLTDRDVEKLTEGNAETFSNGFGGNDLFIYVDCIPVKRHTTVALKNLEDLIKEAEFGVYKSLEAQGKLSKSTPCFDLRLVPYGQGVAELVAHFKANPPTGLVLASSNGLSGIVAEALIPLATEVYKGVR